MFHNNHPFVDLIDEIKAIPSSLASYAVIEKCHHNPQEVNAWYEGPRKLKMLELAQVQLLFFKSIRAIVFIKFDGGSFQHIIERKQHHNVSMLEDERLVWFTFNNIPPIESCKMLTIFIMNRNDNNGSNYKHSELQKIMSHYVGNEFEIRSIVDQYWKGEIPKDTCPSWVIDMPDANE